MSVIFIDGYRSVAEPGDTLDSVLDRFLFDFEGVGGTAYVGYEHNSDGNVYKTSFDVGPQLLEKWLASGDASAFEVRANLVSGSLSGGTTGTWLAGNANHQWHVQTISGVRRATLLVQWRRKATGVVEESATIELEADVT